MAYPRISVEIICKNEERVIDRCLEAISEQISDEDEIIIVDTGSTDKTVDIIKEKYSRVKLIYFEWKQNFAEARNFGVENASKDWIFFIDADEILKPDSLENLRQMIVKIESFYKKPLVFCPRVHNIDDTIVYNAGRIIKNNGDYTFYGCVHEYPIYKNDLEGENYLLVKLSEVEMYHDGYKKDVIQSKEKPLRNSNLDKIMMKEFPKSPRYYFFYYRDARTLISKKEYENGLKSFFDKFSDNEFTGQVYEELLYFLIKESKQNEADIYLKKYWEFIKSKKELTNETLIYLTVLNEIKKIIFNEKELVQTLEATKLKLLNNDDRTVDKGYMFDDVIGYLNWNLGEFKDSIDINENLKKNKFNGILNETISNLNQTISWGADNEV